MDKNCTILKKKEYEELIKELEELREAKKSDEIIITIVGYYRDFSVGYVSIDTTIDLSSGIRSQIRRIIENIQTQLINNYNIKIIDDFEKLSRKEKRNLIKDKTTLINFLNIEL